MDRSREGRGQQYRLAARWATRSQAHGDFLQLTNLGNSWPWSELISDYCRGEQPQETLHLDYRSVSVSALGQRLSQVLAMGRGREQLFLESDTAERQPPAKCPPPLPSQPIMRLPPS